MSASHDQLRMWLGSDARIEAETVHGTYWWPLGLGAALGALGGWLGLRGRRMLGALLGLGGAAGIAADFPPGRRPLRRLLRKRTTYNRWSGARRWRCTSTRPALWR